MKEKQGHSLALLSNSELFWEYNSTPSNEFNKRAELRAEIDHRVLDKETKSEIVRYLPAEQDSKRSVRQFAFELVAEMLDKLEPETLWRVTTNQAGKLSYLTVGEAAQMYKNTAKYGV